MAVKIETILWPPTNKYVVVQNDEPVATYFNEDAAFAKKAELEEAEAAAVTTASAPATTAPPADDTSAPAA